MHLFYCHTRKWRFVLKTLSEEYADNITYAASVVGLVAQKAKSVFEDNIRITVFSDHPLRLEIWCADKTYMALKCKSNCTQISNQVPVIIAIFNVKKRYHYRSKITLPYSICCTIFILRKRPATIFLSGSTEGMAL